MIRNNIFYLLAVMAVLTSCSELDNYDFPNGNIYGKITDKITNESFQSEQPDGFNIKLFEKGGMINIPIVFSGKSDGSFENALIFQNEYKVLITEGAFFPVDTVTVQVGARTEVNFEVMPFLAVTNVSVNTTAGKVTVTYNITRQQVGAKIFDRKTLVSRVPTVSNKVYDFKKETRLTAIDDDVILATQFTDEITGLTPGKTYWVRVGARISNPLSRYNYSNVFEVTIP